MSDSVGQILREARTQKGLSIEQVSQLTHIKVRFLEAMENDQFDTIPSAVQLKGFLRLYADQVGVAVQPLINILSGIEPIMEVAPPQNNTLINPVNNQQPPVREKKVPNNILSRTTLLFSPRKNKEDAQPEPPVPPVQTESAVTFQEIGQTIRLRREALGLSLPDIEEYIHVRAYYLKLIEDGNIQELPSMVQTRGMINNYLNFLDLNTEEIMVHFASGLQQIHFEKTGSRTNPKKKPANNRILATGWRRFLTTDLILGGLVILLIVGLVIWGVFQISSLPDNKSKSGPGSISAVLMETSPAITGTVLPSNSAKLGPDQKLASGQSVGDQSSPDATSTLVFTGGGPLQLYIVSTQRAYLRIIVDGKTIFDGRVLPGNAYTYSGNQQIELLTGNAAAFKVSYLLNGTQNDMGALGSNGEVKSLIFTNQGIITPTPKFTVTATAISLPSTTPQFTATPEKVTITPFIPSK